MKRKFKKNRLKIFIALSLMITCLFGVMFATNTFAYNGSSNTISTTLSNPTNYITSTILNPNTYETDNYIDVRVNNDSGYITNITFTINDTSLNNTNLAYGNYVLLINWCKINQNGVTTATNSSQSIQISPNNNTINTLIQTTYATNYITLNGKQFKTNTINLGSTNTFSITTGQITIGYRGSQNQSSDTSWQGIRIYNIDLIPSDEIYTQAYINTYYGPLEEQYNQLVNDYDELQDDYDNLESSYNETLNTYNNIISSNSMGINEYLTSISAGYNISQYEGLDLVLNKEQSIENGCINGASFDFSYIYDTLTTYDDKFKVYFNYVASENTMAFSLNMFSMFIQTDIPIEVTIDVVHYSNGQYAGQATRAVISIDNDTLIRWNYNITYDKLLEEFNVGGFDLSFYNSFSKFSITGPQSNAFIYDSNNTLKFSWTNTPYQIGYQVGLNEGMNNGIASQQPTINNLNNEINNLEDTIIERDETIGLKEREISALNYQLSMQVNDEYSLNDLMWTIGSVPFESFKQIWNIKFLGVNIADFILGLLTTFIGLYVIKKFF